MKQSLFLAVAFAAAFASCSNDDLVSGSKPGKTPISFNVQKQNITRGTNLETLNHYNFGVWAYKVQGKNNDLADAEVMNNYLVGYSDGTKVGYDKTNATTWQNTTSSVDDHVSPWFYEGLGTGEYKYTGDAGYYTTSSVNYLSNNTRQILRYWDLAYVKTNFYAYAPYNKQVTFTKGPKDGSSSMNFGPKVIRDGYDEPLNDTYNEFDRSLSEYMYAGVQATNADLNDVTVNFKHMGAQLFIRFYEDIKDYRVEIIDLDADNGKLKDDLTNSYATKGIQVAPAKLNGTTYDKAQYYTTQGATVTFQESDASASYEAKWNGSTQVGTPLMFQIPTAGKNTSADAPANLESINNHNVIQQVADNPESQKYSYSPTIYYPVAQPTTSETGFTFHVSYRLIAETNNEVITVHNATVFIPAMDDNNQYIAAWQPDTKYTYTFKITKNTTGTTNPDGTDGLIDPTDPTPSNIKALYPIVFDGATVDDYTPKGYDPELSKDTNYKH